MGQGGLNEGVAELPGVIYAAGVQQALDIDRNLPQQVRIHAVLLLLVDCGKVLQKEGGFGNVQSGKIIFLGQLSNGLLVFLGGGLLQPFLRRLPVGADLLAALIRATDFILGVRLSGVGPSQKLVERFGEGLLEGEEGHSRQQGGKQSSF